MNPSRTESPTSAHAYDVERVRLDFPQLEREVHGKPLVYLDNAATGQRPRRVLEAMNHYYTHSNANVHRGVYTMSEEATTLYEGARPRLARFLGIEDPRRVVFTKGCTEAINLVANGFLAPRLRPGDEILVTEMEHHSNIVPWQLLAARTGAKVVAAPIDDRGELILEQFEARITARTRFVGVVHVSNSIGTINPVQQVVEIAHAHGLPVLVDGAQACPHLELDVDAIGADFYTVSGHKMLGPTGVGALVAKFEHLESMQPWQGGGDMIRTVSFTEGTTFADPPQRFEAGTPPIASVIGLGAAAEYITALGRERIAAHEHDLLEYATTRLIEFEGLRILGEARQKGPSISFVIDGTHAQDIATLLDQEAVCVRSGHHCTQPLLARLGVTATVRASFGPFNRREDVDRLVEALRKALKILSL